jgi:DNA-binding CsgD family transcriptional regulator
VAALCVGWLSDDTAAVVLGREVDPGFRGPELELLRLAMPVITLADAQAADLADSLGARLSPREEEIFSYLQRGYSNRQIGLVLGTSPLTVRNQLARLFRKVGVSSRAELVGLATSCLRASAR